MKIVIASDSFKGGLDNHVINEILSDTIAKNINNCKVIPLLIADGGDGTLDAIIEQKGGSFYTVSVCDPLFEKVNAKYGIFGDSAVISMCESSGLTLISKESRNPELTTTFGTGELIKNAIGKGCKSIYITLGGSATNDGGLGVLTALGYKFIKKDGSVCKGIGKELIEVCKIDGSEAIDCSGIDITILSDVTNPMTGEKGATKVFARQKGATAGQIESLELGMLNFKSVLEEYSGTNIDEIQGGGAAGGMGASLSVLLKAKMQSGVETILNMVDFDDIIKDADYIFTGEGQIDSQSMDGKVISGVLNRATKYNVKVIALVGTIGRGYEELYKRGLTSVFSLINSSMELEEALSNAETLYRSLAENVCRLISR